LQGFNLEVSSQLRLHFAAHQRVELALFHHPAAQDDPLRREVRMKWLPPAPGNALPEPGWMIGRQGARRLAPARL
jgi:hypothetical protein